MVMLAELMRFRIADSRGSSSRLTDLVVSQLDSDYPPVTHLILQQNRHPERLLSWDRVTEIDEAKGQVVVEDYRETQELERLEQVVRLRRDILDALILDLRNHRVTRANDLWLERDGRQLRLSAVDTGARAIWRRLARGGYRGMDRRTLYDWKYIEFLRGDPQAARTGERYNRRIVRLPAGEIAHLTAAVPYLHAAELLELLPEQLAADTLEVMAPERQLQVFEELDEERAVELLKHMAPDVAADLVGRLNTELVQRFLNRLPRSYGERIVELLRYPENTVGGIMANDVITVPPNISVAQARERLRQPLQEPDFVYFIYVVEEEQPHRLRGVLSLRQLLIAQDEEKIEEIMNPYLMALSPMGSPQDAAYRLLNSQLAALPVVGEEGQLLGTVTIDAAVSQVAPRSWRAQAPRVFS